MSEEKTARANELRALLERSRALRQKQITAEGLTPGHRLLAEWQSARLARTYADLRAQKRFRPAVEFFLSDLYGPHDFSQRDADVERVYPLMVKVLSEHALRSIALALELHTLSQEFDAKMVEVLRGELGMRDRLDAAMYAEAFRRCNDFPGRHRQIALVAEVGRVLEDVVKSPVIYTTVRLAHRPAHMMGFGELQDFVERGFKAFRKLGGADEFINTVLERETRILEQIVAGAPPEQWYASADKG